MRILQITFILTMLCGGACSGEDSPNPPIREDAGVTDIDRSSSLYSACDALIDRCCGQADAGSQRPCMSAPSCRQAWLYKDQVGEPSAIERCRLALEESSLYPRCNM